MEDPLGLASRLREAECYAFDLDDTLHSFRKASAVAVTAVLRIVQGESDSVYPLEELEAAYKRILARGTALAFVDGKTSHQYREDRFQQLIQDYNINLPKGHMQVLLDQYEKTLTESLQLKAGVVDLFQTLKRYGYKIAIITEGPQDAQERAVEALGLTPYIDYLATTNKLGVAKTDGMFVKVLNHLELEPRDMIMIGDSWERDIVPAAQAGIYCIHYAEREPECVGINGRSSIEAFETLRILVETTHRCPV
jgi:putative hydrolase of the HAD superfamily